MALTNACKIINISIGGSIRAVMNVDVDEHICTMHGIQDMGHAAVRYMYMHISIQLDITL